MLKTEEYEAIQARNKIYRALVAEAGTRYTKILKRFEDKDGKNTLVTDSRYVKSFNFQMPVFQAFNEKGQLDEERFTALKVHYREMVADVPVLADVRRFVQNALGFKEERRIFFDGFFDEFYTPQIEKMLPGDQAVLLFLRMVEYFPVESVART